jgi:hypothetical protein
MNIFYLDRDPKIAAQMMCDRHVVKMILESAQMLSTAHRVLDGDEYAEKMGLYKLAHKNHPSTIWVRSNELNYRWLWEHYVALMDEYTYRYGKIHATARLRDALDKTPKNMPPIQLTDSPFTAPPQCMPAYCKGDDTVKAYQTYYIVEKSGFAKWTNRVPPKFFMEMNDDEGTSLGLHESET